MLSPHSQSQSFGQMLQFSPACGSQTLFSLQLSANTVEGIEPTLTHQSPATISNPSRHKRLVDGRLIVPIMSHLPQRTELSDRSRARHQAIQDAFKRCRRLCA
jgi:hypothetical protein